MIKKAIKRIIGISNGRPAVEERQARSPVLELLPKGTIGAELGVFMGGFSRTILEAARPARLYLVDPWWVGYGEYYPDWGEYTDNGQLRTRDAYQRAVTCVRGASFKTEVKFCVDRSADWLRSLEDEHLDWVYLDSTHQYQDTIQELGLLA